MTPIIAITMGDETSIGPEVIVKALSHPEVYKECRPVVIGDAKRLQQAQRITNVLSKSIPLRLRRYPTPITNPALSTASISAPYPRISLGEDLSTRWRRCVSLPEACRSTRDAGFRARNLHSTSE